MDLVAQVLPNRDEADDDQLDYTVNLAQTALELGDNDSAPRQEGVLNMTHLALGLSHYVNGVAKKHGEVSREMFNDPSVDSITNGVHVRTWVTPPFQEIFDRHLPDWRDDSFALRNAFRVPRRDVWEAHQEAKKAMIADVQQRTNVALDHDAFTIGFARRVAPYKRADLLFSDIDRLRRIAEDAGPLQVVMAGKAHPKDQRGKEIIQRIFDARDALNGAVKIAFLSNYDMSVTGTMIGGVDLWLNTPRPPNEASGTSGMKAALNGVPQLSTLDGWWLEGWIEGVTGWAIGQLGDDKNPDPVRHADAIYGKLEHIILPLYYDDRSNFIDVMRHAIALNGSFFHTQRMVDEYVVKAYL
jgi:starch phosphorylase